MVAWWNEQATLPQLPASLLSAHPSFSSRCFQARFASQFSCEVTRQSSLYNMIVLRIDPFFIFLHSRYWPGDYWFYCAYVDAGDGFILECYWLLAILAISRRQFLFSGGIVLLLLLFQPHGSVVDDSFGNRRSSDKWFYPFHLVILRICGKAQEKVSCRMKGYKWLRLWCKGDWNTLYYSLTNSTSIT